MSARYVSEFGEMAMGNISSNSQCMNTMLNRTLGSKADQVSGIPPA